MDLLGQKLVVKALSLTIARDATSRNVVWTVSINSEVTRIFYPDNTLPLWHDDLEPYVALLEIVSSGSPEQMTK